MIFAALLPWALPTAFAYDNGNYMISGKLTEGKICSSSPPAPDHGFDAYFDGGPCGQGEKGRSHIEFHVACNMPFDIPRSLDFRQPKTTRELAVQECAGRGVFRSSLRLDNLAFDVCGLHREDSLNVVRYVALRPSFPGEEADGDIDASTALTFIIYAKPAELTFYQQRLYRLAAELHLIPGRRD